METVRSEWPRHHAVAAGAEVGAMQPREQQASARLNTAQPGYAVLPPGRPQHAQRTSAVSATAAMAVSAASCGGPQTALRTAARSDRAAGRVHQASHCGSRQPIPTNPPEPEA